MLNIFENNDNKKIVWYILQEVSGSFDELKAVFGKYLFTDREFQEFDILTSLRNPDKYKDSLVDVIEKTYVIPDSVKEHTNEVMRNRKYSQEYTWMRFVHFNSGSILYSPYQEDTVVLRKMTDEHLDFYEKKAAEDPDGRPPFMYSQDEKYNVSDYIYKLKFNFGK